MEALAAVAGNNVVLALTPDNCIIGFGVLSFPEKDMRWARLGHGLMMEIKVIEVGRIWRRHKIANEIMKRGYTNPIALGSHNTTFGK